VMLLRLAFLESERRRSILEGSGLARGRAGFEAFNREEISLGIFKTAAAAANAAFDAAKNEEGAG
jgi:hypothetical protein